jgi:hypothetical protein
MSYIGRQPLIGNFITCDALTASATTTYNLTSGGSAVSPQTAANCIVSLDGVTQAPTTAYTISGSTIIFSTTLSSSNTIDYIQVLGNVLNIGTPTNGTVTTSSLASGFSLPATQGGTGTTTYTAGNILYASNATTLTTLAPGTSGYALTLNGTTPTWAAVGASAGQVIQVLSAYDSTGRTTTSTSFVTGSNTLSVSITPASASNKILIFVYSGFCRNDSSTGCYQTIFRNATNIGDSTYGFEALGGPAFPCSYSFLDSPATTSATNYQVYFRAIANTARLNQQDTDYPFYKASITVMEIKG